MRADGNGCTRPDNLGDFNGPAQLPEEPTTAIPGSAEKIAILTERVQRRQALHHPLDAVTNDVVDVTLRPMKLLGVSY